MQQPLRPPGARREHHLGRRDCIPSLAEPGPGHLGRHTVSGAAAAVVDRLDGHHRPQWLDRGAKALGEREIVLDQGVLGSHPAADHAVAALGAPGAVWPETPEVGVGDGLSGRAEEDSDRRLGEGVAHTEVDRALTHDLLDRTVAGVGNHAQHPGRRLVMWRQLRPPVGNACPLRILEERLRGDVEGVGVVEAAPADPGTR